MKASARLAGCLTYRFDLNFSLKILRKGSISWGTRDKIKTYPSLNGFRKHYLAVCDYNENITSDF